MLNWKEHGSSGLQVAYFMEYSSTCLEAMRKTIKLRNHDILVSWLRFKSRTYQIQIRSINFSTVTFWINLQTSLELPFLSLTIIPNQPSLLTDQLIMEEISN
jgi:hypothetical protein